MGAATVFAGISAATESEEVESLWARLLEKINRNRVDGAARLTILVLNCHLIWKATGALLLDGKIYRIAKVQCRIGILSSKR